MRHAYTLTVFGLVLSLSVGAAAPEAPTPERTAKAQELLDKAAAAIRDEHFEEALSFLGAARESAGEDVAWVQVKSLVLEGYAEQLRQGWSKAERAWSRIVDQYGDWPQVPEALLNLGLTRAAQGKEALAVEAWKRIVAEAPHSPVRFPAERRLVQAALRARDWAGAAQRVDGLAKQCPWLESLPAMLAETGRALLDAGQYEPAWRRFEQVRKSYPGSEPAYAVRRPMVEALHGLKRSDEAIALLDAAAREQPEMAVVADTTALKADVLADQDQVDAAVQALDELRRRYPATYVAARAARQQADLLRAKGRVDDAIKAFAAASAGFQGAWWRIQVLQVLIDLYREKKDYDHLEDTAAELVSLTEGSPTAATALLEMAQAQHDAGRNKAARQTLEKVVQTYKGAPVVPQAQQWLQEWQ